MSTVGFLGMLFQTIDASLSDGMVNRCLGHIKTMAARLSAQPAVADLEICSGDGGAVLFTPGGCVAGLANFLSRRSRHVHGVFVAGLPELVGAQSDVSSRPGRLNRSV